MRYQIHVINQLFKKKFYKYLSVLLFFFICMIVVIYINPIEISNNTFNSLVGIPNINYMTLLDYLWNLFQLFIIVFMLYNYFSYEEDNSMEFLILRKNYLFFMFSKLIISFVSIVLLRILIYFVAYFIFYRYIEFSFINLLFCTLVYLFVILLTFIFYLCKRNI